MVDDFVITSGGVDIRTKDSFKQWVREFQSKILDLRFETIESFQNADGSRVASRWLGLIYGFWLGCAERLRGHGL